MHTTITLERLQDGEHLLHAYCPACDRWRVLDRERMLREWQGLAHAPSEVQCADCGQFGLLKVRRNRAKPLEFKPAPLESGLLAG